MGLRCWHRVHTMTLRWEVLVMAAPPDQFQKRTYVRLPYTDRFLASEGSIAVNKELQKAFSRPWLCVQIGQSVVNSPTASPITGAWSAVFPAGGAQSDGALEKARPSRQRPFQSEHSMEDGCCPPDK